MYYNPYLTNYPNMQYQQPFYKPLGLQGKVVDNLEVVKAMDISMDGSMNFYPLADGSAIATKQLQQDGTSKVVVYRPVTEKQPEQPRYVTENDIKSIQDEVTSLKKQVEDILKKGE